MDIVEKIRIACVRRGNISEAELARRMGKSPQALHNKISRRHFTDTDLQEVAAAMNLVVDIAFIDPETGERIV